MLVNGAGKGQWENVAGAHFNMGESTRGGGQRTQGIGTLTEKEPHMIRSPAAVKCSVCVKIRGKHAKKARVFEKQLVEEPMGGKSETRRSEKNA